MATQVIVDHIVNNVRAVDRDSVISPEVMHQIVTACVRAVQDWMRHEKLAKEERSVGGPGALDAERDW